MENHEPGTRLRNGCTSAGAALAGCGIGGIAFVALCVVALRSCVTVDVEDPAVRSYPLPREPVPTVAEVPVPLYDAVRRPGYGLEDEGGLILQVWASGRIVWSENLLAGGPPYAEGMLDALALDEVLRELQPCMVMASGREYVIVDGDSIACTLRLGQGHVARTSHVTFETNEELVAEESGIRALSEGETREDVRARQSEAFQRFLDGWDCLLAVHARAVDAATDVGPLEEDELAPSLEPR